MTVGVYKVPGAATRGEDGVIEDRSVRPQEGSAASSAGPHPILRRSALAAMAGATTAGLLFALLSLGLGFGTEVSALLSGALALALGFATLRYLTVAGIVMGLAQAVASAALAIGSIIVALFGLWA